MRWIGLFLIALAMVYLVLCVAALLLIPINAAGWFGMEPDPLAGVFALLLALPWSGALRLLPHAGPAPAIAVVLASMLMNLGILLALGRWFRRRAKRV